MATRLLILVLIACTLFGGGLFVGWRAGSAGTEKLRAQLAERSVTQITDGVQTQIAVHQQALAAQLLASQQFALVTQRIDVQAGHLEDEINEAVFTPPHAHDAVAVDPVATREFVRLYNAAAHAGADPAVAARAAGAGVHP